MSPITLLLIGMAVVLAGVLWLRLHAFLALIIAALTISLLTPHSALEEFSEAEIRKEIAKKEGKKKPDQTKLTETQIAALVEQHVSKFSSKNAPSRVAAEFSPAINAA